MIKLFQFFFSSLLLVTTLQAEILFDLQDQYFEYAYKQNSKTAHYELPNVKVSTVNIYQAKDGRYVTNNASSGIFIVKLNKAVEKFNVSVKANYRSTYNGRTPSIVLKTDTGREFVISFDKHQLVIQNKIFTVGELHKKTLHINIEKIDDVLVTSINGQVFYRYEMREFVNLKRVEQMITNVGGISSEDCLYDISIAVK